MTWQPDEPEQPSEDRAELGAEFTAEIWDFVASVQEDRPQHAPHMLEVAEFLVRLWVQTLTELCRLRGLPEDETEATVRRLVAEQRILYGSLAATEAGPAPGGSPA